MQVDAHDPAAVDEETGIIGRRKATKEEINAAKGANYHREAVGLPPWVGPYESWMEGGGNAPHPAVLKSSKTLREWADEYCASPKLLKEFTYSKVRVYILRPHGMSMGTYCTDVIRRSYTGGISRTCKQLLKQPYGRSTTTTSTSASTCKTTRSVFGPTTDSRARSPTAGSLPSSGLRSFTRSSGFTSVSAGEAVADGKCAVARMRSRLGCPSTPVKHRTLFRSTATGCRLWMVPLGWSAYERASSTNSGSTPFEQL